MSSPTEKLRKIESDYGNTEEGDSRLLNWILFEMAVRMGLTDRTPDDSGFVDAAVFDLVEDFFENADAEHDHAEECPL